MPFIELKVVCQKKNINMVNVDSLFNLFPPEDNSDRENDTVYIDFRETPTYWLGMYKKLILNHINFRKKAILFLKQANSELDIKEMSEAGEFVTYNRAWFYIKKLDLSDPTHNEAIEDFSDDFLDTSLELGIKFFQEIEEYEKCAHILKILKKSQNFLP